MENEWHDLIQQDELGEFFYILTYAEAGPKGRARRLVEVEKVLASHRLETEYAIRLAYLQELTYKRVYTEDDLALATDEDIDIILSEKLEEIGWFAGLEDYIDDCSDGWYYLDDNRYSFRDISNEAYRLFMLMHKRGELQDYKDAGGGLYYTDKELHVCTVTDFNLKIIKLEKVLKEL